MSSVNCGSGGGATTYTGLRIASLFIIWFGSSLGASFPIIARRSSFIHVPHSIFDFAKYFGSGVIIATAFIHLLSPGISELTSQCLGAAWQDYPYSLALALLSSLSIFFVEIIAFRIGSAKLKKLGIHHVRPADIPAPRPSHADAHGHGVGGFVAHGPEGAPATASTSDDFKEHPDVKPMHDEKNLEAGHTVDDVKGYVSDENAMAQIIGVAILEFGVILHSVLIGLTLAVDENFKVLFVVIIFHQAFEGLGVGSRLAYLELPHKYRYMPVLGAFLYGIMTPIGIGIGLGVRTTYNPGSTHATLVSGILDSLSAGILIYTGFVELLAHEFLFNPEMRDVSIWKLLYALTCMLFGCGIMALLGKWA